VVMTDLRQTSATLILGEELDGRLFVRNARKELIVELYKSRGRAVELGVERGAYEVRLDLAKSSLLAKTELADGTRVVLEPRQFGPAAVEATRRRGDEPQGPRLAVDGRNRVSLRFGMWHPTAAELPVLSASATSDVFGGIEYTRYLNEGLSISVGVQGLGGDADVTITPQSVFAGSANVVAVPFILRWNPLAKGRAAEAVKPFVAVGLGPIFGMSAGSFITGDRAIVANHTSATTGGHIGGGVDFHVARAVAIGVNGGYNWMADFERPLGSRDNYSGPEFGVSFGWLFGHGRSK